MLQLRALGYDCVCIDITVLIMPALNWELNGGIVINI
jgi:hypothetical protein